MDDKLDWLTVEQLIVYHTLITVYRIRSSNHPIDLAKQLKNENRLGKIIVSNQRLEQYRKSFIFRGLVNWNSLPLAIREAETLGVFKKQLRDWIKANISRF